MQINTSTDYAVRIILYLAKRRITVSSSKLAANIGISSRYLLQIGARLRNADLISVAYGSAGGYMLKRPPNEISLHNIISVMECPVEKPSREELHEQDDFQILYTAYSYVNTVLIEILKSITIDSLLTQSVDQWFLAPCLINQQCKIYCKRNAVNIEES